MWHLGTQVSDEHGCAGLMGGLGDRRSLFQPQQFYDMVIGLQGKYKHHKSAEATAGCTSLL